MFENNRNISIMMIMFSSICASQAMDLRQADQDNKRSAEVTWEESTAKKRKTENNSAQETGKSIPEMPVKYEHHKIAIQIQNYRQIYDQACILYGNSDMLWNKHIPGLFDILKNAFGLVYEFIFLDQSSHIPSTRKDEYIQILKDVWKKAQNHQNLLTTNIFVNINVQLSAICEQFKYGLKFDPYNSYDQNKALSEYIRPVAKDLI